MNMGMNLWTDEWIIELAEFELSGLTNLMADAREGEQPSEQ